MAERLTSYRIFIASPGDVAAEREIARKVIDETSKFLESRKISLQARGWEDVAPGLGRAQGLINPEVEKADLLVGILWKRFGTHTGVADSGTEEEFNKFYQRWQAGEKVDVLMYFREPPREMVDDPGEQLKKVLAFRQKFETLGLYRSYKETDDFADMLRKHLVHWAEHRRKGVPPGLSFKRKPARGISDAAHAELLSRFINAQVSQNRHLQMTGFETRLRMSIELERVLVPVRARLTNYAEDQAKTSPAKQRAEIGQLAQNASIVDFEQAWQDARQKDLKTLVILGQPGSGKTTLLRHLLLRCAADYKSLGLSRPVVPLFLPLRLVKPNENLETAVHRILETEGLGLPVKFFERELRSGDALLLFDGLDEVASAKEREKVARWLQQQTRRFSRCVTVVTSRFAGYVGAARLQKTPHVELALERFRAAEIRDFLQQWYVTVEVALGEDNDFYRQRGRDTAAELAERIVDAPEIFALATNPLMLQIIALVHRDRGTLPDRRVELYDECTNVLLEHWDRAKGGIDLPLTARQARRVLEPVAYWLHQVPERRYATAKALIPQIQKGLAKLGKQKITAKEFLEIIRDRSGLFVGHGVDEYGFQHLSFQEYLAANQVPRDNEYKKLVRQFGESWWQEVTRLLMGLDKPNCFEPFMRELIASDYFIHNHPMTAACIRDAFEPSTGPFFAALKRTFSKHNRGPWVALRQYYLLLALREMPKELLHKGTRSLQQAFVDALSSEVKSLSAELLTRLGIRTRADNVRINPIDGSELVLVPAGVFKAGDKEFKDNLTRDMELPAFYLARNLVTNAQYKKYLATNPKATKPEYWDDERFNQPEQPVVGVSAIDAESYCEWTGLRLPTEWEWEKGARGTDGRPYPWGEEKPTKERANFGGHVGQPTPVGNYPRGASPYGLMDMAGNVWEWTASVYGKDQYGSEWRTMRGGSFDSRNDNVCADHSSGNLPGDRDLHVGFRCAQDP
jgi:formylglycine-generating enzyme required for sulfatase activity